MMSLQIINSANNKQAYQLLEGCCCSPNWIEGMIDARPFENQQALLDNANKIWQTLTEQDYLIAFTGHPQIGDLSTLQEKYAHTAEKAGHEQSAMSSANQSVIKEMFSLNQAYLEKFGFIFIVCATGKSATEMLGLLKNRIDNERHTELAIAANEQAKITTIRLEKLL
jgi:2-oxo-4-hydroxy-4-carboxy-5-ureidoimidazoline decarboxylase